MSRQQTVGFVGLGLMGFPMARNVLKGGFKLVVHDLDLSRAEPLLTHGARIAGSAAALAQEASVLICMVETTQQVQDVVLGPQGLATSALAGDLVILMSTIDILAVRRIHVALGEKGIAFVDAPVAGMRENGGAQTAALKCFAGGDADAIARAMPVLRAMTSEVTHFGAAGNGTAIKLINSMVMQANRIVACEALALGAKAGLDPTQMVELLGRTYASSGALAYDAPRILERRFDNHRIATTLKDVQLQADFGRAMGMPMFMVTQAQQVYQMARAMGIDDASAVVEVYEQWTGVPVVAPSSPA